MQFLLREPRGNPGTGNAVLASDENSRALESSGTGNEQTQGQAMQLVSPRAQGIEFLGRQKFLAMTLSCSTGHRSVLHTR
jgi:hypothetical protein